jgi:hypothetical protein
MASRPCVVIGLLGTTLDLGKHPDQGYAGTDAAFNDPRHLDTYTQAVTSEKRAAQTAVVALFVGKKRSKSA